MIGRKSARRSTASRSGGRRIRRRVGASLLELQVAMVLLAMAILALLSGLSTISRHLDLLESRQRTALEFSPDGTRAVLTDIQTLKGKEEDEEMPIKILVLYEPEEGRCCNLIAQTGAGL